MTTTTPDPSGAGTGPAGRRLLADIDRRAGDVTDVITARRNLAGLWQLEGRGAAYQRATIDHLAAAGLIDITPDTGGTTIAIMLTAAGRALLGA
jgi:hypothetical protein